MDLYSLSGRHNANAKEPCYFARGTDRRWFERNSGETIELQPRKYVARITISQSDGAPLQYDTEFIVGDEPGSLPV